MSDVAYVIWFIATAVLTLGILTALALEGAGAFHHGPARRRRSPLESRQYWPHTSAPRHH